MKTNGEIIPGQIVKAYIYGDTVELSSTNINNVQPILVLPNHHYLVIATGKVKQMKTDTISRKDNLASVKRTMKKLRRLISANFTGGSDQLWVTLTYANNVSACHASDTGIVYQNFKILMQRVRRKIRKLEYIAVIEPQASGRWHLHVLFKTADGSPLYVANAKMAKLWGKGFTSTKRLSAQDNIAAYVMAYVSNLRLNNGITKKDVKGARLYLYPKGVRIYRRSRGIVDPMTITTTKSKLSKHFDLDEHNKRAFYERTFTTKNDHRKIVTQTEFYNRKEINEDGKGDN